MLNGFLAALRRSRETAEVRAAYDEFLERLDAGQAAAQACRAGGTLVDVDLAVAIAFGIVFMTPPLYAALLRRRGIDLAERSGNAAWLLPVPATFLVGQDGIVVRAWVNVDFTQRPEPTEILAAVNSLQALQRL